MTTIMRPVARQTGLARPLRQKLIARGSTACNILSSLRASLPKLSCPACGLEFDQFNPVSHKGERFCSEGCARLWARMMRRGA